MVNRERLQHLRLQTTTREQQYGRQISLLTAFDLLASSAYIILLNRIFFSLSVALNYQTEGRMMQLNRAKFMVNGGIGYVLKPPPMCKGNATHRVCAHTSTNQSIKSFCCCCVLNNKQVLGSLGLREPP